MSATFHEKEKIRFAVIGSGHIGKRHAEMIRRNPEAELAALCDIRPKNALGLGNEDAPFFQSVRELFDSGVAFDVASVCTPNGLHAEHSLLALERKKHVVCEKPMALTVADCEKIIFKALQVSRQVFCVMQNRYSPPSVWIRDIVDRNILGKIYHVQLNCFWNRDERYYKPGNWKGSAELDGGTLFTQFSHFIDIMYWLFGDITDIQGKFEDFAHQGLTAFEDSGIVNFRFINGGIGCINYSTAVWDKNLESSITVLGENGSIKIGGQYMNEVEYCHIRDYTLPELAPASPANDYGAYKGSAANHHFIIENVIDTLKGRTSATTNALEGLKVVDIIERIYSLRNLKKLSH
jgi:UDP-N-acetyl-2-amino-2-deoxyglucuronate dehydrogenase